MLFRGTNWHSELSINEIQEIMARTNAWFDQLTKEGTMLAGQPLEREGKTLSFKNGSVADGPFTESKESIGGYILIEAPDLETAVEIARGNPMIPQGLTVEIRQVADNCPANRLAQAENAVSMA